MAWSDWKNLFLNKLKPKQSLSSPSRLFFPFQQEILDERTKKGRDFLVSLDELRELLHPSNEEYWRGFLRTAMLVMARPSEKNYLELHGYLCRLRQEMKQEAFWNYSWGGARVVVNSLYALAGGGISVSGAMLLDCVVAGTCVLAMGPWGAAALGVGLMFLGVVIAVFTAFRAYKNFRLCRDSQLREIEDFVNYLDPQPGKERKDEPVDVRVFPEDASFYMTSRF